MDELKQRKWFISYEADDGRCGYLIAEMFTHDMLDEESFSNVRNKLKRDCGCDVVITNFIQMKF